MSRKTRSVLLALVVFAFANATVAQAQTTTPDSPSSTVAKPAPRVTLETSVIYWQGRSRSQLILVPEKPVSRLTSEMDHQSVEVHGRLDIGLKQWLIKGLFVKGFVGLGETSGKNYDEDWNKYSPSPIPHSNTVAELDGMISSATVDVGVALLKKHSHNLGIFIGYNHYTQKNDLFGCVQLINPGGYPCLEGVAPSDFRLTGIDNTSWNSLRFGAVTESKLNQHFKINGEVALMKVKFAARDNHLLRYTTTWFDDYGFGWGWQVEATASYAINDHFSVTGGWRYWSLNADGWGNCTSNSNGGCSGGSKSGVGTGYTAESFSARRSGLLVGLTGKF